MQRILPYIKDLRRRGVSSTIVLYAISNLKGAEREAVLRLKKIKGKEEEYRMKIVAIMGSPHIGNTLEITEGIEEIFLRGNKCQARMPKKDSIGFLEIIKSGTGRNSGFASPYHSLPLHISGY